MTAAAIQLILIAAMGAGDKSAPIVRVEAEPVFTLTGDGVSNDPVMADGKAYLTTFSGLTCVDVASGEVAWFADGTGKSFMTPVVLGDLVITAEFTSKSSDPKAGCVHAYDVKTGAERWTSRLNGWIGPEGENTDLALMSRTDDAYTLNLLDARTGEVRHQMDIPDAGYAHPVVAAGFVMFATDKRGLEVRRTGDCKLEWWADVHDSSWGKPTCDGKRVYCVGSDDDGSLVRAFELETGKVAWTCALKAPASGRFVLDGTRGYMLDWGGTVTAIDVADGKVAWTTKFERGGTGSVAVADGLVFASVKVEGPNDKSQCMLVAVSAESGRVMRASQAFAHEMLTAPATGNGVVLVGSAVNEGQWVAWKTSAFLAPDPPPK